MSAVPTYIGGPSAPPGQVAETISGAFQRPGYDRAWMLTAITERTGIARLAPGLRQLRRNGAEVEGIVAIEPGAADAGNLYEVLKQIPTAYALTKPGLHRTGTYYYVAAGGDAATVVLGPPGLANTAEADPHESALLLELDLTDAADAALLQQLRAGFDRLIARTDICRPLTDDLVPELVAAAEEPLQPNPDRRATGEESGIAGFFKVLSRNDASLDHSPGQIIIPRRFLSFFSELTMGRDRSTGGGPRQRHREFSLTFVDGEYEAEVSTARVVLYSPAEDHPRRNPELRFTFRDRSILERLSPGDALAFRRNKGKVVVERKDRNWNPPVQSANPRYGELPPTGDE